LGKLVEPMGGRGNGGSSNAAIPVSLELGDGDGVESGEVAGASQVIDEKDPRYYGWRVVLAANLGIMVGFSVYAYTFGIFVKPLSHQFAWNREAISQGFALSALAAAIFSPLAGGFIDRFGLRRLLLGCMTAFGGALGAMALLRPAIWQFYATCVVVGAVGNISQIGFTQAISTWFHTYRGRALGVVLAGDGLGLMLFPVIAQSAIAHAGWRTGYALLGGLVLAIGLPPAIAYGRAREEQTREPNAFETAGSTLRAGLASYRFWIIVSMLFLSSTSVNGAMTHQVPLLTDRGVPPERAALTISVLGVASVLGRLLTGWLLDRYQGSKVAFVLLSLGSCGIFLLAHFASFSLGCLAAVLLGVGAGGTSNTTPYLLTRYFGMKSFSTLYGLTWTFYAIAGGLGPVLMGRVFDRTGSYASTLNVFGCLCFVGAVLMLFLPRYQLANTYA
jgi:MFS family permease